MDMEFDDKRMYRIFPAPERKPPDEYIAIYARTKETEYFEAFLHYYEPSLNRRAQRYCSNYWVEHLFADVKQTIVMTLYEYAHQYDISQSVSFLAYTKLMVQEAVHDLIRQNGGVHSIAAASHYRRLRKVNFLHYANLDLGLSQNASIRMISEQLSITEKKVISLIAEGKCFRDFVSFAELAEDTADEDVPDIYERYDRGDKTADPGEVVPNALFMDEVVDAVEELPFRQREILYRSCGIRCMACGRTGNRETYADIANMFQLYSESAVEKLRKAAIKTLYEKFAFMKEFL